MRKLVYIAISTAILGIFIFGSSSVLSAAGLNFSSAQPEISKYFELHFLPLMIFWAAAAIMIFKTRKV